MLIFLLFILAFVLGVLAGYILRVALVRGSGYAGTILITETEDKKIFSLELNSDPEDLADQDEVIFKVSEHPSSKNHSV